MFQSGPGAQSRSEAARRIPVHVVVGFLGSGKSSLIRHLVAHKPSTERWAIVINEFGQVGIDQAMFAASDSVVVKGLPGGCLCCQLSFVLQAALVNLLHRERPDRLIIEPSGLGHPAGLLDMLRGEAFREVLEVREVLALLDPRRLDDPRSREHPTFRDQLLMADCVALSMTDLASEAQRLGSLRFLDAMWPPKRWIGEAPHGRLPCSLVLDGQPRDGSWDAVPKADETHRKAVPAMLLEDYRYREPLPGHPLFDAGEGLGHCSMGWRWHADDVFSLDALTPILDSLGNDLRVKGVWHTDVGWRLYNRADERCELTPSAWRRDSRLEVIGAQGMLPKAGDLEARLQACRVQPVGASS